MDLANTSLSRTDGMVSNLQLSQVALMRFSFTRWHSFITGSGKVLGCPKFRRCMALKNSCSICNVSMEAGWVACPFCGWHQSNFLDPNLSIMEHARSVCSSSCDSPCGNSNKKPKSKCCKRYKKKSKKGHCKRCPKKSVSHELTFSIP